MGNAYQQQFYLMITILNSATEDNKMVTEHTTQTVVSRVYNQKLNTSLYLADIFHKLFKGSPL